ncbi:SDR family NAD(P)-dependent oxidoreductase [Acinetobacter sp.]|uniref:SDR family NAD(P)-dependent oxidoreductase n=1 Tax=Acinetobacter sp. TaxID=472 RepID=UPI00333F76E6
MGIVAMKITDAVIFITGANRGLGLALAQEALRRGAQKVYAGMRNIADFNEQGMIPVVVDVTDPISIQNAVAQCGDVNILVNNAGIARLNQSPVESNIVATTQTVLETNLYGVMNTTQYFCPILESQSESYIVNILSDVSWEPSTLLASYAVSKAAAWSFTNSTRQWLSQFNVHVMGVHVGFIDTDLTQTLDIPKISPSTVAKQVFEGIEDNAFEVLVGASTQALKKDLTATLPSYIKYSIQK